jgi:hypothetical protein
MIYPTNRDVLWKQIVILITVVILIAAFCSPPVAARDVKVAITELKPSLYTDERGKPTGFFVDLIEDLADKKGWNIIWISGTISESWERLNMEDIDLIPAVTITQDRTRLYNFTNESALSIWSQVYARPESGINTILDLDKKRIAMVKGASSGIALMDYAQKFGVNATYLEKERPEDIFALVAAGEADAFIAYNSADPESYNKYGLVATPVMFNPAQFGFAALKGKNQDLLILIDTYIAEGKNNPSSTYNQAMQKWYGIKNRDNIPVFLWWILGGIASLTCLFVSMSYILRREVNRKTAELAYQNEELSLEVANRTRAEKELALKNEELHEAYEQLVAMQTELRENFQELKKSDSALIEARKKLNLFNTLTNRDIKNAFYILSGYIQITKDSANFEDAQVYYAKEQQIIQSVQGILAFTEKYQNLGINQPRWQTVVHVLLLAISHLDLSNITRTVDLPNIEIYADPLFEDVFLALINTIIMQSDEVTRIGLRCQQNIDGVTILVESNGQGIQAEDKEQIFTWEHMGKGGSSLFLAREILSITEIALQETGVPGEGICFEITVPKGQYRIINIDE